MKGLNEDGIAIGKLEQKRAWNTKIKKKNQLQSLVRAFMSTKIITIHPEDSPGRAAYLMIKHDIGRLPGVEEGKIVGIFSRSDAVADLYGLCLLGDHLATGCMQNCCTKTLPNVT
jgi:tRNA nucleotidyltransferase (CCA-adding enzyme)